MICHLPRRRRCKENLAIRGVPADACSNMNQRMKKAIIVGVACSLCGSLGAEELPAFPFRTDSWLLRPHGCDSEYRVAAGE
jgi:hypothetical protein